MSPSKDVYYEWETGLIVNVFCSRCRERLARLEVTPPDAEGADADLRRKEVSGEVDLVADEHYQFCPNQRPE